MEKIILTEEQKENVFKGLGCGDIWGLIILKDIIDKNFVNMKYHEIHCLLNSVIDLNAVNDLAENGDEIHVKYASEINELYYNLKRELLNACNITREDFEKYGM